MGSKVFLYWKPVFSNVFSLRYRPLFILSWNVDWMTKWKLKLNSLQRTHHLCVCWLSWRMNTQYLWRLQVRWAEIWFPASPPLIAFLLSQPACPKNQRDKGRDCNVGNSGARKSWTCVLVCDTSVVWNWGDSCLTSLFPAAVSGLQCGNTLGGILQAGDTMWSTLNLTGLVL